MGDLNSYKRKANPNDSNRDAKKKKKSGGNGGKWQTPQHISNQANRVDSGASLDVGDQGIWVTCVRGMERKAIGECLTLFGEYGKTIWDIEPPAEDGAGGDDDDEEVEDIEEAIKKELTGMKPGAKSRSQSAQTFMPVKSGIECVFFMRSRAPVQPIQLVSSICVDALACKDIMKRKCKYLNRLTPVTRIDKASEQGIQRVARSELAPWFDLNEPAPSQELAQQETAEDAVSADQTAVSKLNPTDTHDLNVDSSQRPAYTYAIRQTIRNHSTYNSAEVIKMIANMVGPRHKVQLTNPDKIVVVEIYQMFCGISVVDGKEWEATKRFNIAEIYKAAGLLTRKSDAKQQPKKDAAPKKAEVEAQPPTTKSPNAA